MGVTGHTAACCDATICTSPYRPRHTHAIAYTNWLQRGRFRTHTPHPHTTFRVKHRRFTRTQSLPHHWGKPSQTVSTHKVLHCCGKAGSSRIAATSSSTVRLILQRERHLEKKPDLPKQLEHSTGLQKIGGRHSAVPQKT